MELPGLMPLAAEQLAALIERHAVPLQLLAGRRCRTGDDVVQEAFCRLATVDPSPDRPVAWLYRVVRNLAENHRLFGRRRRSREQRAALPELAVDDPADRLIAEETVAAVMTLDDSLREVVTARIWGQLTFEEIGELCDISTATASRRYREALVELRKLLGAPCPTKLN